MKFSKPYFLVIWAINPENFVKKYWIVQKLDHLTCSKCLFGQFHGVGRTFRTLYFMPGALTGNENYIKLLLFHTHHLDVPCGTFEYFMSFTHIGYEPK